MQRIVHHILQNYGVIIHFLLHIKHLMAYNKENHVIYAASYGTYYINKYLQLFPNKIDAVILDGLCSGD